jgi:hypothetical protein
MVSSEHRGLESEPEILQHRQARKDFERHGGELSATLPSPDQVDSIATDQSNDRDLGALAKKIHRGESIN